MTKSFQSGLIPNTEISYLQELIQDFGTPKSISATSAFELLRIRYENLEKNIPLFLKTLSQDINDPKRFPFNKLIIDSDYYPAYFAMFSRLFHSMLFDGILINAGKLRSVKDPRNGYVGFGGDSYRKVGSHNFAGTAAKDIEKELNSAFLFLKKKSKKPIEDSLEFYRSFVRIHPFYDANGRIGRLILNIYLLSFDYYINWREIETGGNKTNFIKKLNECHKRENKYRYDSHFNHLLSFFKKFVISTDEFKDS